MKIRIPGTALFYIISFLANLGIGMLNFSLVFFMKDRFHTSASFIGWMSALWAGAYLAGCIVLRRLSESMQPPDTIRIASAMMGGCVLVILFVPDAAAVFAAYLFFGFITSLFWPPLMGWLSRGKEGKTLSVTISRFNLAWSSGIAISPYLAGLLLEQELHLPFYCIAGLYFVVLLLLCLGAGYLKTSPVSRAENTENTLPAAEDKSTKLRFATWIGILSSYLLLGAVLFVFPLFARDFLGMSETGTGLLLLLRAVSTVIGFQLLSRATWWHHNPRQVIIAELLLLVLVCCLMFITHLGLLIVFFLLFGQVFALQYSSSIFHGVFGSINRERRMAIHEGFLTIGLTLGAAGAGTLYQYFSMRIAFLYCAVLIGIGVIFQLIFLMRSP